MADVPCYEIQVGRFRIRALTTGRFALDGGAMFGIVPRAIWGELTPVHEDHTVPLATTAFLVEDGTHTVLLEPGIGSRWSANERAMFHIEESPELGLAAALANAGCPPESVTHCLMTHTHWDHIGAAVGEDGRPVLPRAEHWTPQIEVDALKSGDHLRRASYRLEDLLPLEEADLLHTFTGEAEPVPGIRMVELGGHSDGVSVILVQDAGETACFWADVVPTRHHVPLPWIMAYDMNAEKSWQVRSEWIPRAAEEGWWCLLYHDPDQPIGKFVRKGKRFAFQSV